MKGFKVLMLGSMIATVLLSNAASARQILCPGDFHFVNTGDDINTVIQTCGQPKRRIEKTSQSAKQDKPTYWYYYGTGNSFIVHNTILKFYGDKLSSMVVSGSSSSSMRCVNGVISTGDSKAEVRQKCGFPVATADQDQLQDSGNFMASGNIQQRTQRFNTLALVPSYGKWKDPSAQSQQQEAQRSHKFTVLIYQPESYMPETAFMFIDGRLTQSGPVDESQHQ